MILVSLFLLTYTIYNAIFATIGYDEAYTYIYYGSAFRGFFQIDLANNHPLNSLLIYLSSYFFEHNDFMIRLPNIVFLVLYLFYAIKISKRTKFKLLTFGLLTLYWYLIPGYFSQARGYGISASLVIIFLYQFLNKPHSTKNILSSIAILLLASYAFLGLIPLVISVCIYYLIFEIKNFSYFINKIRYSIICLFSAMCYVSYLLFSVSVDGKPLYGAFNNSFLESTIGFYSRSFLLGEYAFGTVGKNMINTSPANDMLHTPFLACIIGLLVFIGLSLYKKQKSKVRVSLIAIMCFSLLYFSSVIMNKPFITGRSLLPFFPVIALALIEIIENALSFIKAIDLNEHYQRGIGLLLFISLLLNYQLKTEGKIFHIFKKDKEEKVRKILKKDGYYPPKIYYEKKK